MTKLKLEYIRLGLSFFTFVFITASLFMYINQVKAQWFQIVTELFAIPSLLLTILIPIWLIVDLARKKVADKSIFNLTFFVSVMCVLLLVFSIKIIG